MNRRRFLAMLGILPAALALPKVEPTKKVTVSVTSVCDLIQDLRYSVLLLGEGGPEMFT